LTPSSIVPRAVLTALLILLTVAAAQALPRYGARYGQKCLLCHVDPAGGGMRSAYASQYLIPDEMSLRRLDMEAMEGIDPALSETVSLGADLRTLYRYSPEGQRKAGNNFFQMQGDLYLHIQADEKLALHVEQGLSGATEVYGLAFVLPAGGYVKAGRFAPAYGWRFADHRQFVRRYLGFAPPGHSDVGLELGLFPGSNASLSLGVLNGAGGRLMDGDNRPAFALRAELRHALGALNLTLGASGYRDEEAAVGSVRQVAGPFASLAWGPLVWVGEWDWERRDEEDGEITALAASQELAWQLRRGLDLRATWNFYDPDTARLTGSHRKIGLGCDLLASPFMGILAMLNHESYESGDAFAEEDHLQAELVLHFLY